MTKRLLISGNFSVEVLDEGMKFWATRLAWPVALGYTGYNALLRDLADRRRELRTNTDGFNALILDPDDPALNVAVGSGSLTESLTALATAASNPLQVVVLHSRTGTGDARLAARLAGIQNIELTGPERIEAHLDAPPEALARAANADAHVPFGRGYWLALSTALARRLDARLRAPRKVLALDCDDTLWQGVVGEDGVAGLRVGPAQRALQARALELTRRGWLLCLASKNDDEDVRAAFEACPGMLLGLDQISARRVNWAPKSENLASLAAELGLGLDAFVFVDDSPLECAQVRAELPEVCTLRLPEADRMQAFLDAVWVFDPVDVTSEDRQRADRYRHRRARAQLLDSSADFAAFVDSLELEIEIAAAHPDDAARVSQLSHRTNQFNLTGLKLSEAEARKRIESSEQRVLVTRLRDRFGNYGLVGAMLARQSGGGLELEGFYLSCRALGRGVEHAMCAALGRIAAARPVRLSVTPLTRNEPARRFFDWLSDHHGVARSGERVEIDGPALAVTAFDPHVELPAATSSSTASQPQAAAGAAVDYQAIAEWRDSGALAAAVDARLNARPDLAQAYVAPAPGIETQLADIWREVLHLESIGCDDEFQDLGGRSIQLVEIHRRIRERTGHELDLTDLFRFTTVRALAHFLVAPPERTPDLTAERARRQIAANRALAARRLKRHG